MFFDLFKSVDDIASCFSGEFDNCGKNITQDQIRKDLKDAKIHLAWYSDENYMGRAWVIFEKDGQLYEVHGSHCSCFRLEGQWDCEQSCWKAIAMRDKHDLDYDDSDYDCITEVQAHLNKLLKEHNE